MSTKDYIIIGAVIVAVVRPELFLFIFMFSLVLLAMASAGGKK